MLLNSLWQRYPAFYYACWILIGCYASLYAHPALLLPITALIVLTLYNHYHLLFLFSGLFVALLSFSWVNTHYTFPNLPQEGIEGSAILHIDSVQIIRTPFSFSYCYRGSLKTFTPRNRKSSIAKNLPVSLFIGAKKERPPANKDYRIYGLLKESKEGFYTFKPLQKSSWTPISHSHSWAQTRYNLQEKLSAYIHKIIPDHRSATFLAALASGAFSDPSLRHSFSQLGMQHIMAISGFHFAILAACLSLLLQPITSARWTPYVITLLLTIYAFITGGSPSIIRAWVMCQLLLWAPSLNKISVPLNNLGLGILACMLLNPLSCTGLGFQFSFAITAAILLLYTPCHTLTRTLFAYRPLNEVLTLSPIAQGAYAYAKTLQTAFALLLSVNSIALPLTLYHFQQVPLLTLVYNLFYPFLVAIALFLLLITATACTLLPPLGYFLGTALSFYTKNTLALLSIPPLFQQFLYFEHISTTIIALYITVLFCGALCINSKRLNFFL